MTITIAVATEKDIPALYGVANAMGHRHEAQYFEKCLSEQQAGNRTIFLALTTEGIVQGYVQLNQYPLYNLFRRFSMPEIQDLCVIPDARRQGIGGLLIDACEAKAKAEGKTEIGISVALHGKLGQAQRLYVRKGYIPDGNGIAYDDVTVTAGEMRAVDELLALKLTKEI